ncbi:MAG TPA: YkgJ family cysteine cluster protein [Nitrospira sp.]
MQAPHHPQLALASKTDDWFKRTNAALLSQVPCHAGCSHCCIGPFPITQLDVSLLQEGLEHLPSDQRSCIEKRAVEQVTACEAAFPRLRQARYLDHWSDEDIDRLVSDFHRLPCPALSDEGLCALYEYRPLACRSMGIPIEEGGMVNGACTIQTFVPIVRLSRSLREEADALSLQEAQALDAHISIAGTEGEELLLPYGFLPQE